jgi:WD40 repeat protein
LEGHDGEVWSVKFNHDGHTLISASGDRTVRLWNLRQPGAEPTILRGHQGNVTSVAFSPDGTTVASGSSDDTIRFWNLADPAAEPTILSGHEDTVRSVAFSPDGTTVASGSIDQTIRLWNPHTKFLAELACQKVWRNLTREEWARFMPSDMAYRVTCSNLPIESAPEE